MPITMSCPACGKTLTAPESAVGKRAKCPGCGQIMVVSALAPELEEFQVAPLAESSPGSGDDWMGGLGGANQASVAATASGGEARRPCPECGEMIVGGAAKCRFCNAIFDPKLRKVIGAGGNAASRQLARYQRGVIVSVVGYICGSILLGMGNASQSPPLAAAGLLLVVVAVIAGLICVVLVATRIYSTGAAVALAILMLVPCVNLIVLLSINQAATKKLQENGIKVGFFGANMSQF